MIRLSLRKPAMNLRYPSIVLLLLSINAFAAETVLPLKVDSGGIADRDTRTFTVALLVNGKPHDFAWGCSGWTMVSESFAKTAGLKVTKDETLESMTDAAGKPMFAGAAEMSVTLGGQKFLVYPKVIKDAYSPTPVGTVGYDIASLFQWEFNPDTEKPTLTLRPLGTKTAKPLAVLPLVDDGERVWLSVNVRNVPFDLVIMPQASDIMAGPAIQKKWDLTKGKIEDVPSPAGPIRTATLSDREPVALSKTISEKGVTIVLIGSPDAGDDLPASTNGVGASILNRYVYVVDTKLKQFIILSRRTIPTTQPAK